MRSVQVGVLVFRDPILLCGVLYLLLYVFGFAFAFYPLSRWCKANEGCSWPWPHV